MEAILHSRLDTRLITEDMLIDDFLIFALFTSIDHRPAHNRVIFVQHVLCQQRKCYIKTLLVIKPTHYVLR